MDEGLIDLQLVKREADELEKRRVPGAKVVHGEFEAFESGTCQDIHHFGYRARRRAFSYLERQHRVFESVSVHHGCEAVGERDVGQAGRREIQEYRNLYAFFVTGLKRG